MIQRVRKAFVLGAGLGTRLRPLTNLLPKPLLPIFGKPLITFAFDHLRHAGVEELVVNTHHLPQKFVEHFPGNDYCGASLALVHEPELLETGGGIKNIERQIGDEHFLVYSGDILTDVAVERLIETHCSEQNDVTLALRTTKFSTSIHWSAETGRVLDIQGVLGTGANGNFDFAGISVWSPSVFARIPMRARISFVPVLIAWIKAGGKVGGLPLEEGRWFNIGSNKEYVDTHKIIVEERWLPYYLANSSWPLRIDPSAHVAPRSEIEGGSYVGAHCLVEEGVLMEDSILLPGSFVPRDTTLQSCIVAGVKLNPGTYLESVFV
jgi:mannose-1-phosphate guanylyltransferase